VQRAKRVEAEQIEGDLESVPVRGGGRAGPKRFFGSRPVDRWRIGEIKGLRGEGGAYW
jgi:hypothetical protein